MTESPLIKTHADPQLSSAPSLASVPFAPPNGVPVLDGFVEDEESSTIKCICGYQDDDGSTVLCENCNTWQHILCYYDSIDEVQDVTVHECIECKPRAVDLKRAEARQRNFRVPRNTAEKKVRRAPAKSHKKKVKDVNNANIVTNGWPLQERYDLENNADRKSASPREGPPTKRPKTAHRSSGSVAAASISSSRKRASSTAHNGGSPTKSPTTPSSAGYPADYFSPEFLQLYAKGLDFEPIDSNSYPNLQFMQEVLQWRDGEALQQITNAPREHVFQDFEGSGDELEQRYAPLDVEGYEDKNISIQGQHPRWMLLINEADVLTKGSYIGEIKGQIEDRDVYCEDPSNRWGSLRHPEPHVFFHPYLPIVIDARRQGTDFRYARRSCRPTAVMRTVIADGQYHFTFVATESLKKGAEITVGWEIEKSIKQLLMNAYTNGDISREGIGGLEELSHWVSGVLSNFGGCACNLPPYECLMERSHRRNTSCEPVENGIPMTKSGRPKKRKGGNQISPLGTGHATNSRAGSEVLHRGDQDDDRFDSRSTSGSTRSKPGSRDITPMTHLTEGTNGVGTEMSERERRKLQQQERFFEQLEQDEQHSGKRRKRNSAGSALTTPTAASSVSIFGPVTPAHVNDCLQKHFAYNDGPPSSAKSALTSLNAFSSRNAAMLNAKTRLNGHAPPPTQTSKATYTESAVQTDATNEYSITVNTRPAMRRPYTTAQEIWRKRAREDRLRWEKARQEASDEPPERESSSVLSNTSKNSQLPLAADIGAKMGAVADDAGDPAEDVVMQEGDGSTVQPPVADTPREPAVPDDVEMTCGAAQPAHPPIQPPPPPWPSSTAHTVPSPQKQNALRVELPPPPNFTGNTATTSSLVGTPPALSMAALTANAMAQSPAAINALNPLLSPSVGNVGGNLPTPSPVTKKISFSDYKKRQDRKNSEALSHNSVPPSLPAGMSSLGEEMGRRGSDDRLVEEQAVQSPEESAPAQGQDSSSTEAI